METHTLTIKRDPEYAKIADAFLESVNESMKNVEFGFVTSKGDAFIHKNGSWEKVKERIFLFNTPQIK